MRKGKRFLMNVLILSISSFVMRSVGASFHVYLSNSLGAVGIGLFQLIMSVEMFAATLAVSGISLTTTRLVSETIAESGEESVHTVMKHCIGYALFFGILSAVLLFFLAEPIGKYLLGEEKCIPSLKILSAGLPFLAMSSVLGGYFTAVRRAEKVAAAQLLEQTVKIALCVFGLKRALPKGAEYACMAVVGSGCIAEMISFFFLLLFRSFDRPCCSGQKNGGFIRKNIAGKMLHIALPIAFGAYARSALTTTEHILIPPRLTDFGYGREEALARYGTIQGMTFPILLFPSAVLTAFAGLLVPEMAEYHVRGSKKQIHYVMTQVLHAALAFAIGVCGVFFVYSDALGMMIYRSAEVGMYLKIFAPLVIVMYLDGVVDAMLKGLNQQLSSMRYNVTDSFVSVLLVCLLLPRFGIGGYVAVIYVAECLNGFLSLNRLICVTNYKIDYGKWLIKPCAAILTAAFSVRFGAEIFDFPPALSLWGIVCRIACTAVLYFLFLIFSFCISREDFRQIGLLFSARKR